MSRIRIAFDQFTLFQDEENNSTHVAIYAAVRDDASGATIAQFQWNNRGIRVDEVNTYPLDNDPGHPNVLDVDVRKTATVTVEAYGDPNQDWPTASSHDNALGTATVTVDPTRPATLGSVMLGPTTTDQNNTGYFVIAQIEPAEAPTGGVSVRVRFENLVLYQDEHPNDTHLAIYAHAHGPDIDSEIFRWNNAAATVDEVNVYGLANGTIPEVTLLISGPTAITVTAFTSVGRAWPTSTDHDNFLGAASVTLDPTDPDIAGQRQLGPARTDQDHLGFLINVSIEYLAPTEVMDAGPDEPAGSVNQRPLAAGVIADIAGDLDRLYVVSKTAGVWISSNGGAFGQSPGSPREANRIAIDPANKRRLAVGGRAGDAVNPQTDTAGLYESADAGTSWTYTYDPFPDTGGQQIYALAYTTKGTLLLGTWRGVGRRETGYPAARFDYPTDVQGEPIRALTLSETRIWARTTATLFVSADDGKTWAAHPLPRKVDIPGFPGDTAIYDHAFNGNDRAALAAFDDAAYITMHTTETLKSNKCLLLIFDARTGTFKTQLLQLGDGTGLGGARFIKAYTLSCPSLPAGEIGQGRQLYYCAAQDIAQATSEKPDRTLVFGPPVSTAGSGQPNVPVHSDIWAFHISPSMCPPANTQAWIGGDGGLYRSTGSSIKLNELTWVTHDDGLHTHNIAQMTTVASTATAPAIIGYSTTDNDAWWRGSDGTWHGTTELGDATPVIADAANRHRLILGRNYGLCDLVDLTNDTKQSISPNPDAIHLTAIQTPVNETVPDKLDLVMLTRLPVHDAANNALPMDLFTPGDTSNQFLLLRNQSFTDNPNGPASKFAGWAPAGPKLPGTPHRVWVSGGHAAPTYYLATTTSDGTISFFKYESSSGSTAWTKLLTGLVGPVGDDNAFTIQYGPAFVSPYDADLIHAVATDTDHPAGAVFVSSDGGGTFAPDAVLTALLTNSGRYPIGNFSAAGPAQEIGSVFHGGTMFTPSQVAHSRTNPDLLVACSPVTGVFVSHLGRPGKSGTSLTRGDSWRTLTPHLPDPYAYPSAVDLDLDRLYIATQGRGLLYAGNPYNTINPQPATFFDYAKAAARRLAVLRDNLNAPIPDASIELTIQRIETDASRTFPVETRTLITNTTTITGPKGTVAAPDFLPAGTYLVALTYHGDIQLAPTSIRFLLIT